MPPAAQKAAARQEASVPGASVAVLDVSAGRFRQAALPAPDGPVVPPPGAVAAEGAAVLDASQQVAEAVASDAAAAPRPAAGAVLDATEARPQEAAAVRDGEVGAVAVPHAAAAPQAVAARVAAAVRRGAAEVRAVAGPRRAAQGAAAEAGPAGRPSAVAWACRQGRLRPAAP
jgi:hypothetical protein